MARTNLKDSIRPEMLAPGTRAKIIARNTFRFTAPDGATVTRLHITDIVRALPRGRYQLDSGGWRTVTTKDRIASAIGAAGYRIWANKGSWYVGAGKLDVPAVPYYDGMILPDAFKHKGKAEKKEAAEQKLRLAVRKFCAKLDGMKELPVPRNGDCWLCCMKDKAGTTRKRGLSARLAYLERSYGRRLSIAANRVGNGATRPADRAQAAQRRQRQARAAPLPLPQAGAGRLTTPQA